MYWNTLKVDVALAHVLFKKLFNDELHLCFDEMWTPLSTTSSQTVFCGPLPTMFLEGGRESSCRICVLG